jgi:DNA-binding transcriptional regulator YiaG
MGETIEVRRTVAGVMFEVQLPNAGDHEGEPTIGFEEGKRADLTIAAWLAEHGHVHPEAFRFMRKALGLQASQLADLLGVTRESVSRWENGKHEIPRGVFLLLGVLVAHELEGGSTVERIMGWTQAPEAPPPEPITLKVA